MAEPRAFLRPAGPRCAALARAPRPASGSVRQAFGVVTNAQDFMRLIQLELMARI